MIRHINQHRWLGIALTCFGIVVLSSLLWLYSVIADPVRYEGLIVSSRIPFGSGPFLLFAGLLAVIGGLGLILMGVGLASRSTPTVFREIGLLMIVVAAVMSGAALFGLLF